MDDLGFVQGKAGCVNPPGGIALAFSRLRK